MRGGLPFGAVDGGTAWPTDFRYEQMLARSGVRRLRWASKRLFGFDPVPAPEVAESYRRDLFRGDPLAEAYVEADLTGEARRSGRRLLDRALDSPEGFAAVAGEASPEMRVLFDAFEAMPAWVDRLLVEEGARIWRRWGRTLFNVAGAETLEMYTESAVALPLSLAGGYAGENALRRFLETARFWIDVSEPGALFRLGSAGRATAMRVRVMHVSVRRRVMGHDEWDPARWGVPISQAYMTMTLIGGSVSPAMLMWPLGYVTSPREIHALLHYQRYLGHLLGVQPGWYPETARGGMQLMFLTAMSRSYSAGEHGAELIESFPRAFAPRGKERGLARWRAAYEHRLMGAYTAVCMSPLTRRRYDMPAALPWVGLLAARMPVVLGLEVGRRIVPGLDDLVERRAVREREAWWAAQMEGRRAAFEAQSQLRR